MSTEISGVGYVPPPSIGHEIGVMFGFIGAMALTVVIYVLVWQHGNKVGQRREAERRAALRASGWFTEKQQDEDERHGELRDEIPM